MNLEQKTITSVEVAEMVGKSHNELLKDMRRYTEQLGEVNIPQSDFFKKGTYLNSQNKEFSCYLVTKKGCEFIGNKLTGTKGTEFTAKYINKFHDMEETIQTGLLDNLSTEMKALIMHDKKIQAVVEHINKTDDRLDKLEYDIPLYGCEAKEVSDHVKRKGVQVLGGKKSNAYKDNIIRSSVYRDIYDQVKREFGLYSEDGKKQTYLALKRRYLSETHEYIDGYEAPLYLQERISDSNSQIDMSDIA